MAAKIVLITGCSSGIGLATALHLAKDAEKRFKVYATMRNLAKKGQLEGEGKEYLGDTLIIKQLDVCSDESVTKTVKEVLDAERKIDVLLNNAGLGLFSVFENVSMEMAKQVFEVNFFGALRMTQAVLPSMKAEKSGLILQTSGHFGIMGAPFFEVLSAAKFALEGLTEAMAPLLLHFNVRCSLIEPGPVVSAIGENMSAWTKDYDRVTPDEKTLELLKSFQGKSSKRVAGFIQTAEEIAKIVENVILSEKPNLRYLTNPKYSHDEVATKYADIPGNKLVELLSKNYLEIED